MSPSDTESVVLDCTNLPGIEGVEFPISIGHVVLGSHSEAAMGMLLPIDTSNCLASGVPAPPAGIVGRTILMAIGAPTVAARRTAEDHRRQKVKERTVESN